MRTAAVPASTGHIAADVDDAGISRVLFRFRFSVRLDLVYSGVCSFVQDEEKKKSEKKNPPAQQENREHKLVSLTNVFNNLPLPLNV